MERPIVSEKEVQIPQKAFEKFLKEQIGSELKGFKFSGAHSYGPDGKVCVRLDNNSVKKPSLSMPDDSEEESDD